jgi:hypothetical protein
LIPAAWKWNSLRPHQVHIVRIHSEDQRPMNPASFFTRRPIGARLLLAAVAALGLVSTPDLSRAQDAGVSGIPPGPANARGLNGSVNDPSGIGNAAKVPAIPPPTISPAVPPAAAAPTASYRGVPMRAGRRFVRTRYASRKTRRAAEREAAASIKENDRLLDRKLIGICRGC